MPLDTSKPPLQQIGNYDLLTKLAEGGMGMVYKGRNRLNGEVVAIKIIPNTTSKNPVLLQRFAQEFRAASALDHPNVVRAIEYCGTGPTPFLVMEFVDGESLGQRIERDGAMPEAEALSLMAQVCQGLHRAHRQGLIHRDVKPDNIMVTKDGVAKLTDLGLVKDVEGELNLTRTGRGLGTPHFMAPEQFRNAKNVDVRCDIYSLGATLYMMVTGEVPFGKVGPLDCWMKKIRNDFVSPRQLRPELSDRVDWAIRRSMSADPEKRPASCKEFIEDLHGKAMKPTSPTSEGVAVTDVWYLVYKDESGETHTVKGTTEGIRRALKEGLMGDATGIRACRTKQGPFQPVHGHPEFRDLVVTAAPINPLSQSQSSSTTPTGARQATPPLSSHSWKGIPPATGKRQGPPDPETVDLSGRGPKSTWVAAGAPADPNAETVARPHIPFDSIHTSKQVAGLPPEEKGTEWWMWVLVLLVALATAFAAIVFLPKLHF